MVGVIYKFTNIITEKNYIGFTVDYQKRFNDHIKAAENGSNYVFHKAIRKYRIDNFDFEIIESSDDTEYLLNIREEYWIRRFDSHYLDGYGYNMTYGGGGTLGFHYDWTDEQKQKQSIRMKEWFDEFSQTEQYKEVCDKLKEHGMKGSDAYNKRYTPETRKKMSDHQKQRMTDGYNPKASKWIVKDPQNNLHEILQPTEHFGSAFVGFWRSHKKNRPITKGQYKHWQLVEIIRL